MRILAQRDRKYNICINVINLRTISLPLSSPRKYCIVGNKLNVTALLYAYKIYTIYMLYFPIVVLLVIEHDTSFKFGLLIVAGNPDRKTLNN